MSDTEYTIYLVNESAKTQVFWCFLAPPEELASDPDVYANSSTSLAVDPDASSINTFTIPVQYVVEAGASTCPVGPNIKISSTCKENVELRDIWDVEYATVPPRKGPKMTKSDEKAKDDKIKITSNDFDQTKNETDGWFSSMSFGIKTDQGFIGMTWAPGPQEDKTLTPVLKFYVATGTFEDNELAEWTTVSKTYAEIKVPHDFKYNKTTVTLTSKGNWEVNPGAPPETAFSPAHSGPLTILIETQRLLSAAQKELVGLVKGHSEANIQLSGDPLSEPLEQKNKLISVKWEKSSTNEETSNTHLTGTITVGQALLASFTLFVLANIEFECNGQVGNSQVRFSYSGPRTVEQIKAMFIAGANLLFRRPPTTSNGTETYAKLKMLTAPDL